MVVPEVDKKLLEELEAMGFPVARATRALHYSGRSIVKSVQILTVISFCFNYMFCYNFLLINVEAAKYVYLIWLVDVVIGQKHYG
jgi:hypothetical protein